MNQTKCNEISKIHTFVEQQQHNIRKNKPYVMGEQENT